MATQNSIDHISNPLASSAVTVDPGAAGDSYVQFNINTTNKFRIGSDDDAGDAFKISQGNALGTNDTFVMTTSGERTMPLQPAFLALVSTNYTYDVTGDGSAYVIIFDTERYDQNSDYNNATGVFTASVDGRYYFNVSMQTRYYTASHTLLTVYAIATSRTLLLRKFNPGVTKDVDAYIEESYSFYIDMTASHTIYIELTVSNHTKTIALIGYPTILWTTFSGMLVC